MKKLIALLLAITMLATLCAGCSKSDDVKDPKPTDAPTTTIPSDNETEFIDKCDEVNTTYSVIAATNFNGVTPEEMDRKYDEAMEKEDVNALNKILNLTGQTIALLPHNNKYTYNSDYESVNVANQAGNTVEVYVIVPTEEFDTGTAKLVEKEALEYDGHSGQLYEAKADGETIYLYMGYTAAETLVGAIGKDAEMVKDILSDMIIVESTNSAVTDIDEYLTTINPDKQVATYVEDYQAILCFDAADKYECKAEDGYICLINNATEHSFDIGVGATEDVAEELSMIMLDDEFEAKVKYISTQNIFGFAFHNDEEAIFYGFDKDSYTSIFIASDGSIDELFDVIKSINVRKCAFSNKDDGLFSDKLRGHDDAAAAELANAVMFALADQDIWDELVGYICDGNFSSYVSESADLEATKVFYDCGHENAHYYYDADARVEDGMYSIAGYMRGITITFHQVEEDGKYYYVIGDGIINEYVRPNSTVQGREDIDVVHEGKTPDYENHGTVKTLKGPDAANQYLYARVRATVGEKVEMVSSYYRDVPLTVFIALETTDGYVFNVEGQFGGCLTN